MRLTFLWHYIGMECLLKDSARSRVPGSSINTKHISFCNSLLLFSDAIRGRHFHYLLTFGSISENSISWQLKSVIRPRYYFPWSLSLFSDFIFGALAQTWQDLKARKKNSEGFQISESNSGRTVGLERLTITTSQRFLDQLKNKNIYQFSHCAGLVEKHVTLSSSFIFAVSVYFMSAHETGRKNKVAENCICSLGSLYCTSALDCNHWHTDPKLDLSLSVKWTLVSDTTGSFNWGVYQHQPFTVHVHEQSNSLLLWLITSKSRLRNDCFQAMIDSKKRTPKTAASSRWVMTLIWLMSRKQWRKWTTRWLGSNLVWPPGTSALGSSLQTRRSLWHYWSRYGNYVFTSDPPERVHKRRSKTNRSELKRHISWAVDNWGLEKVVLLHLCFKNGGRVLICGCPLASCVWVKVSGYSAHIEPKQNAQLRNNDKAYCMVQPSKCTNHISKKMLWVNRKQTRARTIGWLID